MIKTVQGLAIDHWQDDEWDHIKILGYSWPHIFSLIFSISVSEARRQIMQGGAGLIDDAGKRTAITSPYCEKLEGLGMRLGRKYVRLV